MSRLPEVGDRLRAVHFDTDAAIDDNITVPPGTLGTVWRVAPEVGQIGVMWDNGSTINLLTDHDEWEVVKEAQHADQQ